MDTTTGKAGERRMPKSKCGRGAMERSGEPVTTQNGFLPSLRATILMTSQCDFSVTHQ